MFLGYQRTDSMSFTGVMRKPRAIFTMLMSGGWVVSREKREKEREKEREKG